MSQNKMPMQISNNRYDNLRVDPARVFFLIVAPTSDLIISNETIFQSTLDDLVYVVSSKSVDISNIDVSEVDNTGTITTASSLYRIDLASESVSIVNFTMKDSTMDYGTVMTILATPIISLSDVVSSHCKL